MEDLHRTAPFITFKQDIARRITRAGDALERGGDARRPLATLHAALRPWGDDVFREEVKGMEVAFERIQNPRRGWPRPSKPDWQYHFFTLLIDLAKRRDLLDIEIVEDLDEL